MDKEKNKIIKEIISKNDLNFQKANQDEILVTIPHKLSTEKELHIKIETANGGWNIHIYERSDKTDFDLVFEFISKDDRPNSCLDLIFDSLSIKINHKLNSFLVE